MKTALAIRHVAFEDAGSFASVLDERGYDLRYLEAGVDRLEASGAQNADLLIVLGGPIGAYDERTYPFLSAELALLEKRLHEDLPTLGICLGAQLMARALDARVYPGGNKEIGWGAVELSVSGKASPLAALGDRAVLHWHGDTFDLPHGADLLASTDLYRQQAFSHGKNALALQFHVEVEARAIERWLIGHACELGDAGIDVPALRTRARLEAPALEPRARELLGAWLDVVSG